MAECPGCHGEGGHEFAADDALLAEHLSDAELAFAKMMARAAGREWGERLECDECEGTGVVSDERAADLRARAIAYVDQIRATVEHRERLARRTS